MPTRSIFTLLSIVVAFMLFGVLQGVNAAFDQQLARAPIDILLTSNPSFLPLPLADLAQIQQIPGVSAVAYQSVFSGFFQSVGNSVAIIAVDPRRPPLMFGDFTVPDAGLDNLRRTRTGALISARLAERFHWRIGDHVPLQTFDIPRKDGGIVWTFDIVGIFDSKNNPAALVLFMNYSYFDAERARDNSTVQQYFEKVADPSKATEIANAIDDRFINSGSPTHTDTERGYLQASASELGGLQFFLDAIIGAAFATLLLLIGSNMMQSFRERVPEFAVMKTMGFPDGRLALLVLCEAVLLCTGAAAIGLLVISVLLGEADHLSGGNIRSISLPWTTALHGITAAALIALSSTLPAAWSAKRLSIIDALAVQ